MKYWERKEKLFKYVDGVRQFFPLATEQLDSIARLIDKFKPDIRSFLDLGCGDGFLGHFIYQLYPGSKGVFIDISAEMIRKARLKDADHGSEFIVADLGENNWFESISSGREFDLIISGYAIHHIGNREKQRLYRDIYGLLNPGGIFLNLEHVASPTEKLEEIFNELFLDRMSDYQKHIGEEKTMEEIKEMYYDPRHKKLNILAPVEEQCDWLRKNGFLQVDCYMKIFELALFGGVKK